MILLLNKGLRLGLDIICAMANIRVLGATDII
jgi:hypothetical protein